MKSKSCLQRNSKLQDYKIAKTYLCCKLISYKQAIFDFNRSNHVLRQTHHHLLLLELLCMEHGLLLPLHLLLVSYLLLKGLLLGTLL